MAKALWCAGVICAVWAVLTGIEHAFGQPCALWTAAAGSAFTLCELIAGRPAPSQTDGDA